MDYLVCPKIQKFLLHYKKVTFAQACDIEVSMELAEENAKFISDSLGKSNMLKLKDTHLQVSCYRCRKNILCPYVNAQTQSVIIVKSKDIYLAFEKQLLDKQLYSCILTLNTEIYT